MRMHWMVALALVASPAWADGQPPSPPPADKDKLKVVCVKEAVTGSHIRRRSCMTEAQREERRQRDREALAQRRDRPEALPSGR